MPGYPTLPTGVAYYQINFAPGTKYSQGWYGTCINATPATVWLYDDDNGICLISCPIGPSAMPSGMQDGHTITPINITNAQALINSYNISDFTAIDSTTLASMNLQDFYTGAWGGDKLGQKFIGPPRTISPSMEKHLYDNALNTVVNRVLENSLNGRKI